MRVTTVSRARLDERKKVQKFINFCLKLAMVLIWNISNSTWRQLIVLWKVQNHNVRSSGHNARSALLDRGTGTIDLRQLLFWHRKFSFDPTNYERCLHPNDTLAYRGVHNNSFLTLRVIHELKKGDRASFVGLLQGLYSRYNKITLNGKKNPCRDLIWWKKIPANSNAEKKCS